MEDHSEVDGLDQQLSSTRSGHLAPKAHGGKLLTQSSFKVKVCVMYENLELRVKVTIVEL